MAPAQPWGHVLFRVVLSNACVGVLRDLGILSGRTIEIQHTLNWRIVSNWLAKGQIILTSNTVLSSLTVLRYRNGGLCRTACPAWAAPAFWAFGFSGQWIFEKPVGLLSPLQPKEGWRCLIIQSGIKQCKMKENCVVNGLHDGRFIASGV